MGRIQIVAGLVAAQADKILVFHLGGEPTDQIVLIQFGETGLELFQQTIQFPQPGIQVRLVLVVGALYGHGFASAAGLYGPIIMSAAQVIEPLAETAEVL